MWCPFSPYTAQSDTHLPQRYGRGYGGWVRDLDLDLDLDLGADLKAHRTPGVMHDGAPDDTAYRPAMPYDALSGPSTDPPVVPFVFPGCLLSPCSAA